MWVLEYYCHRDRDGCTWQGVVGGCAFRSKEGAESYADLHRVELAVNYGCSSVKFRPVEVCLDKPFHRLEDKYRIAREERNKCGL